MASLVDTPDSVCVDFPEFRQLVDLGARGNAEQEPCCRARSAGAFEF